jgi:hypothetical protein
MKRLQHKGAVLTIVFLLLLLTGVYTAGWSQEVKQLKIGMLQNWYQSHGSEPEEAFLKIQQTGLEWPAMYQDQDCQAAKALWIGTSNYTDADQYGGNFFPHKVVHVGPRGWDVQREFIPIEFQLYGKYEHPNVYVDGFPATDLMNTEREVIVDPELISDRMIYNEVNTSIGMTQKRRIFAWGQEYHSNYFIYEYTFVNTGNVDGDPEIEQPDKTLEDVWFYFQYRYVSGREGTDESGINDTRWGKNMLLDNRGEFSKADGYNGNYQEYLNGDMDADSMRCTFAWMGQHSAQKYNLIGSPDVENGTGRFMSPQIIGNITLWADKSAQDHSDDPFQPRTTSYQQSDDPPTRPNDQFDAKRMSDEWKWITRGHRQPRHVEAVGEQFPDLFEGTPGGFSNTIGYGPYTLAPGDSVRIVIAEAVSGLSRQQCEELGRLWYEAYANPSGNFSFELPDGSSTDDKDEFKNAWVLSGKDSLFQTFSRARRNFELGYDLPSAPPPPNLFNVNSGGDGIYLSWSNNAEADPNFSGYRVYRAVAIPDTTYGVIFECGEGTDNPQIVNEYKDATATRGFDYYYYIVSFSSGEENQANLFPPGLQPNPSGSLESSLFWTKTRQPANLRRAPGETLADIRVVPNPYNVRNKEMQYPGVPDRIAFLDIPGQCTIKIFTERGDMIQTIEHDNGSGDEFWNSVTRHGQVIVSGVYIAVFETPDGQRAIRKFVVIR